MVDRNNRGQLLPRLERRLPELYLLVALILTSLLCFLTPPFFPADEANQSCRAISLGHGSIIPKMGPVEAGAQLDAGAAHAMDTMVDMHERWEKRSRDFHDRPWGPIRIEAQRKLTSLTWTHTSIFVPFANTAVYGPFLYAPAVIGWRTGEAAHLTIFQSLRLARLLSAWTAVALGWLALRLCACSRWLLLPMLLLPSTLFVNASSSQDAVLLSVAALIAAILTRPLAARREFTSPELAVMAALISMCGMARPPYAALALLLFLPTAELPRSTWHRWLRPSAAFAAVFAVCGVWRHLVAPLGGEWSDDADPETQLIFIKSHPVATSLAVLKGTWEASIDFFHRGLYVIGGNELLPHHGAAAVLTVCLIAMVLFAPACPIRTWRARVLLALAVAGPLLGISLAEYIIWSPPGFHTVWGIQPRYWLPLMPFAAMLLQGRLRLRLSETARSSLLLTATAVLVAISCTLPWLTAHGFYAEPVSHVLSLNLH